MICPRTGGMPASPLGPVPAHQMEQHGFQIIVRSVRSRNFYPLRGIVQPRIADTAGGFLHALALLTCRRSNVHPFDRQFDAQLRAQRPAERFVPIGLRAAQAVVEVERPHCVTQFAQYTQQRHRIPRRPTAPPAPALPAAAYHMPQWSALHAPTWL